MNRPDLFVPGADDRTYPLTETGVGQARRAGAWAVSAFDWVKEGAYVAAVSQFVRAQQTYRGMGLPETPLLVHPGLNEQDWGDFMGPDPPEGLRASFDAEYETRIGAKAPNGESTLDVYHRLRTTLLELAAMDGDGCVLLVAHGRVLLVLRMVIEGVPPSDAGWRFLRRKVSELPNCGALWYPAIHLSAGSGASRQVAVVEPPYSKPGHFSWQSALGTAYEADPG